MSIRSAARGLVVDRDWVLPVKSVSKHGVESYLLPGGGQNQYESILDAVAREVLEESGYRVKPTRLVAVCEQIFLGDPELREKYPDYTHRVHHIFLCELLKRERETPTELDLGQAGVTWMSIEEADRLENLQPFALRGRLAELIQTQNCEFIGTEYF